MTAVRAAFDTFSTERFLAAPASLVFRAWSDPALKAKWFGGPQQVLLVRERQFVEGGRERVAGRFPDGHVSRFDAIYLDIVPDRRIVYTYEMHWDERKISASLATIELFPEGDGTRMVVTEQGVFLDGYEDRGSRAQGTSWLMDKLVAAVLAEQPGPV